MKYSWIDGTRISSLYVHSLLSSYVLEGQIIIGQVRPVESSRHTTWSTFDTSGDSDELIADGYKSIHEAKTAMEQYWAAKEPALPETPQSQAAGRTNKG